MHHQSAPASERVVTDGREPSNSSGCFDISGQRNAIASLESMRAELRCLFRGLAAFDATDIDDIDADMVMRVCERMGYLSSKIVEHRTSAHDRMLEAAGIVRTRELQYVDSEEGQLSLVVLPLIVRDAMMSINYYKYVIHRHLHAPMYGNGTTVAIQESGSATRGDAAGEATEVLLAPVPGMGEPPDTVRDADDREPTVPIVRRHGTKAAPRDRRREARSGDFLAMKLPRL